MKELKILKSNKKIYYEIDKTINCLKKKFNKELMEYDTIYDNSDINEDYYTGRFLTEILDDLGDLKTKVLFSSISNLDFTKNMEKCLTELKNIGCFDFGFKLKIAEVLLGNYVYFQYSYILDGSKKIAYFKVYCDTEDEAKKLIKRFKRCLLKVGYKCADS